MPTRSAKEAEDLKNDVRTMDSKLSLLTQKLGTIEKNEEVLGRTLVAHNERLREMEEGETRKTGQASSAEGLQDALKQVEELKKSLEEVRRDITEMKYVLNSINPLEFVTVDQVKELLKQK